MKQLRQMINTGNGGFFYCNKNDPSLLVPKKFGIGWTVNFANKWSYIIIGITLLPILLVIFI